MASKRTPALLVLLLGAPWLVSPPTPTRAQDVEAPPREGALFLLLPFGAGPVSLGRAMTAMKGPESVFWNPAGLTGPRRSRLTLIRGDHAVGTATGASVLGTVRGVASLGLSYVLLDAGSQDLTDDHDNLLGTISIRNHLAVASGAVRLLDRLDVGANLKLVQFRLSCRGTICPGGGATATTYAADVGVQLEPSRGHPLRFGALLAHLGRGLEEQSGQRTGLPARVRVAVAYDLAGTFAGNDALEAWLSLEVQDRLRDPGSMAVYVGSEVSAGLDDALLLRAGYVFGEEGQERGARVGMGIRYQRFDLAVAKSLASTTLAGEPEPFHVTLSTAF